MKLLALLLKAGQKIIIVFIIQEHFGHDSKVQLEDTTLSKE